MAKYELPQYQSVYRDPGSVQINQLKRQQFLENMQADNALATSVMNMDALEEDNEQLYALADKYNSNIDERATRRDYENLGMTIHRDAMDFIKDYTPIKKSKDLYTAYEKMLSEKVTKGDITSSIKERKLAQSRSKYKGVQYTPAGTVDQNSYFKGEGVANYVDVNAEFAKAMKDVVERKGKYQGYELRDGDFEIVLDRYPLDGTETSTKAGAPVWLIKKGKKILGEVDSTLVADVTSAVLRRDDVASYLRQEADLSTYMFTEEEAQEKIDNSLSSIDTQIDDVNADKKLSKERKAEKIKSLKEYKAKIVENVEKNGAKSTLLSVTHDDLKAQYLQDAQNKYVYRNEAYSETPSVLNEEGVGAGSNKNKPAVTFQLPVEGALTSVVIGGFSTPEVTAHLAEQTLIVDNLTKEYKSRGVSVDLLYNADTNEEIENIIALMPEDNKIGKETVIGDIKNIRRAKDKQRLAEIRLEEARKSVYKDGENEQDYKERKVKTFILPENVPGTTNKKFNKLPYYKEPQEILEALIKANYLEEDATIFDAMTLIEGSTKGTTTSTSGGTSPTTMITTSSTRQLRDIVNVIYGELDPTDQTPNVTRSAQNNYIEALQGVWSKHMSEDRKTINDSLDNSGIKFDALVDTSYGDPEGKTKTAINDAIKKGLSDNIAVITEAGTEPTAYKQYIREKYGEGDVVEIDVNKTGLVNVANPNGVPMLAISIKSKVKKGDDINIGDTEYIFIPQSEINAYTDGVSTIDNYVNSTGFKVNRLYAEGLAHNVSSWSPEIFTVGPKGEESSKVEFKYKNEDGSENSKPIIITSMNDEGVITTTSHSKAKGLEILERLLDQPLTTDGDTYAKYLY